MNRLTLRAFAPVARTSSPATRTAAVLPRLSQSIVQHQQQQRTKATSSPKKAEKASAQSGGSRSKEAVETGSSPTAGVIPDSLSEGDMRGRTGGGEPLESSHAPPAQPKISNASVPGSKPNLTKEQQAEVDQHNKEFEEKHGKAEPAGEDKVNKSFWSGGGTRKGPNSGSE